MSTVIKVITKNLKIEDYTWSFDYTIFINGRFRKKGTYESNEIWHDAREEFEKLLTKENLAITALEKLYEHG